MAKSVKSEKKVAPKALMSTTAINTLATNAVEGVKEGDMISGGAVLKALQTIAKNIAAKKASEVDASNWAVAYDAKWREMKRKPKGEMNNSKRTGFIAVARIGEKPWHVEAFKRLAAMHDAMPIAETTLGHLGRWLMQQKECPSIKAMEAKRIGINNLANGLREDGKKRKAGEKGKRGKKINIKVRLKRVIASLRGVAGFTGYTREMGPHIARILSEAKACYDMASE